MRIDLVELRSICTPGPAEDVIFINPQFLDICAFLGVPKPVEDDRYGLAGPPTFPRKTRCRASWRSIWNAPRTGVEEQSAGSGAAYAGLKSCRRCAHYCGNYQYMN